MCFFSYVKYFEGEWCVNHSIVFLDAKTRVPQRKFSKLNTVCLAVYIGNSVQDAY